ncbi:MAG: hypothetical protein ACK4ME_07725, partial [Fimbriimonadales bacterium]
RDAAATRCGLDIPVQASLVGGTPPLRDVAWTFLSKHHSSAGRRRYAMWLGHSCPSITRRRDAAATRCGLDIPVQASLVGGTPPLRDVAWTFLSKHHSSAGRRRYER